MQRTDESDAVSASLDIIFEALTAPENSNATSSDATVAHQGDCHEHIT
jgi:hypothetical protein